ncbi:caprin-2 [Clinocottus analis]|uniref:caprin-2 n=1 Tax=Clinocottus analis TaxID=304258 RepID=UPI0035BFC200
MVQLPPSPPSESSEEGQEGPERPLLGSLDGPHGLQLSPETSTVYYGYESYVEDGLICLKHKVRNLEKKKLRLKDYKRRLNRGEELNKDQKEAVEKYEEVLHNLAFARELHQSLDVLTQDLLTAQKEAVRKQQAVKEASERRRLSTVLQMQHLLLCMQQQPVRRDLLQGRHRAPLLSAQRLQGLSRLAALLGYRRDAALSLQEQMEAAALAYLDLLEGKEQPVAGSTFKLFKEELSRLLTCEYFTAPEVIQRSTGCCTPSKSKPKEVSDEFVNGLNQSGAQTAAPQDWKAAFQTTRQREPPDCWDVEFSDGPGSLQAAVHKAWRGAAALIPKDQGASKKQYLASNKAARMGMPVEVFSASQALPKDPVLRKQHLEDFMTKIHGSCSFMQDSLLDDDVSPTNDHQRLKRRPSGSPWPLGHTDLRSPVAVLSKAMHSTPLPARLLEPNPSLTDEDQCLELCDLKLSSTTRPQIPFTESRKQSSSNGVPSCPSTPPQGLTLSTPPTRRTAYFHNMQPGFKVTVSLPPNGELNYKPDFVLGKPRCSIASTQTPPEFAPSEDEPQMMYQSDYTVGNGGAIFLSPGQSGGSVGRPSDSYHTRGSVGGMALAQRLRLSGWHPGGPFRPQTDLRDAGPRYAARNSGYQHSYRYGGARRNSSAAWSDSSQVSTPDREAAFTIVDSGHGDSLSVSTVEVPLTPQGHHHTLLPMQLHPLSQPLRVAFNASRTANFAPGNLDQPIVFEELHSNVGEMYDPHIGRFTCPVNGTYVFIFHILKLAINVPLYINLMRNEEVMVSAYANDGAPDHETASNHAILPLFQGDQVWLRLHRGAIYGSTWKYSTFSGFLLYQD